MRRLLILGLLLIAASSEGADTRPALRTGDHRAAISGATIAYHVFGSGPVVMVHPGGPGIEWSFVRMPRLEKFATVVYIEPIGTGASTRLKDSKGYTIDRYVSDVEGLRAHLGLERFVLLGHSHGGFVAQAYALAHQAHLRGLVLYDTSPITGPEWEKDVESNVQWFKDEPWFAEAQDGLAHETSANTDEEMTVVFRHEFPLYFAEWTRRAKEFEPYRASVQISAAPGKATTDSSASSAVGIAPVFDVRARLGEIHVPTLVIVGKKDFVTSEKFANMIHEGIRGSRLLILLHSGHMGHIEEPAAFADGIHAFLRSLPR
jgi:proline iminopeptidase